MIIIRPDVAKYRIYVNIALAAPAALNIRKSNAQALPLAGYLLAAVVAIIVPENAVIYNRIPEKIIDPSSETSEILGKCIVYNLNAAATAAVDTPAVSEFGQISDNKVIPDNDIGLRAGNPSAIKLR